MQVVVEAILGPGCALAGSATDEKRADARLTPGLAPRRCHPGPPLLSWSESSSPARECAQGRGGRGDDQKRWRGVSSPRSADPPPPAGLASFFSTGRSTRPFSSPCPQIQGVKYSRRGGREMEKQPGTGRVASSCETIRTGGRRGRSRGEGVRGGGGGVQRGRGRGARSGQLEPSGSCQQAQARSAPGLGRACVPGTGFPPAGSSGSGEARHLDCLALLTSPRGFKTAQREKERWARTKPRLPSPGLRLLLWRLLPPLPPPASTPSLAKPPPRWSHTSL